MMTQLLSLWGELFLCGGCGLHGLPDSAFMKYAVKGTIVPFLTSIHFTVSWLFGVKVASKKCLLTKPIIIA